MTRAAFLFSGQLRGFKYCIESMQNNLFSAFDEYDTFFYIPTEDAKELVEVWNPTSMIAEPDQVHPPVEGFGNRIVHSNNIPGYKVYNNALQHYWLQWYGVKRVFQLFDDYRSVTNKHYDVAVRIRCEFRFEEKYVYEPFDGIQIPDYKGHQGIYDRLALGPVEHMRYYCSIYDKIREGNYHHDVNLGNSESKLLQHLHAYKVAKNVSVKLMKMSYVRIRTDGSVASDPENPG